MTSQLGVEGQGLKVQDKVTGTSVGREDFRTSTRQVEPEVSGHEAGTTFFAGLWEEGVGVPGGRSRSVL